MEKCSSTDHHYHFLDMIVSTMALPLAGDNGIKNDSEPQYTNRNGVIKFIRGWYVKFNGVHYGEEWSE